MTRREREEGIKNSSLLFLQADDVCREQRRRNESIKTQMMTVMVIDLMCRTCWRIVSYEKIT